MVGDMHVPLLSSLNLNGTSRPCPDDAAALVVEPCSPVVGAP
jgi:hypothetical protein